MINKTEDNKYIGYTQSQAGVINPSGLIYPLEELERAAKELNENKNSFVFKNGSNSPKDVCGIIEGVNIDEDGRMQITMKSFMGTLAGQHINSLLETEEGRSCLKFFLSCHGEVDQNNIIHNITGAKISLDWKK